MRGCGSCAFSSWNNGRGTVGCFDLLRHGPGDSLLVGFYADASALSFAHGFNQPLAAERAVRLTALWFSVFQDVLALCAVAVIAVFLKVSAVNPHFPGCSGRRGLSGGTGFEGAILKLHSLAFLSSLLVGRHGSHLGESLSVPTFTLRPSRDRAG